MKILPLVIHAGLHIPRWTDHFSDALAVDSIDVVSGGLVTITTTAAHGVTIGEKIAVSITESETPNPITAATVQSDGDVLLTTEFPHDLTTTPDATKFRAWNGFVKLSGFTDPLLNGTRQLVDVPDRDTFVVRPGGEVLSVTLNAAEVLHETLDGEVSGWHAVTAATTTTLTFPTPAAITRDYTVINPSIVRNIRVFGALNPDVALERYNELSNNQAVDQSAMFIMPLGNVRVGRSRFSSSDAQQEIHPGTDFRIMLLDGFEILVLIPSLASTGHVEAVDVAQGEVLKAVLRTFLGLVLTRSELACAQPYAAVLEEHGGGSVTNKPTYAHTYRFQAAAYATNEDAIAPWEWGAIDDQALADGDVPDSIYTVGAPAFRDLNVTGIYRHGSPSPLTGNFEMDDNP